MILEILLSLLLIYFLYSLYLRKRPKCFPPGPVSWPIFGNLLQVGMEPYKSVMAMRKYYGDIIGIDLGSRRAIFINDHKLLREALNLPSFSGRPIFHHYVDEETGASRGIILSNGKTWTEQRRFAFSYIQAGLRNEENVENQVQSEITKLMEELKKSCGTPMNTRHIFNISTVNTLWNIIAGKTYSINDPAFMKMVKHATANLTAVATQGLFVFYPKFSMMLPKLTGFDTFRYNWKQIIKFMKNIVEEHKQSYEVGIKKDFVDLYLHKIKETTDPKSMFYNKTGEEHCVYNLSDLFLAGTDTISGTLNWLLFLMSQFPEVQRKLINIMKLNSGISISLKDQMSLPYIDAVIQEVLRFSSLLPVGVFQEVLDDVDFHGYKFPKGTMVVPNQYGIMHDPEVWGDPENFRPERFLTKDESEVIRHPAVVPFGIGRRTCPGESFARDELFLFVASIFQNFRVEFDPSLPPPPLKYVVGGMLHPVDHKIIFYRLSE